MNMDSLWSLMDFLFVGAGFYMIFSWYLLKTKGEIKADLVLPKDTNLKKCKDLDAYKAFIAPKMLVMGIGCLLYGVLGLVNTYAFSLPMPVYVGSMAVFFAVILWFAVQTKNGYKKYW